MFAFAIYDGRRRELFAARDRLGKKPFFYTRARRRVSFRQRAAGAARSRRSGRARSICTALEGYFSLGYFLAPATIYRDVHKLMPGHWLRVADGRVETRQYWDVTEFDTDHRPDASCSADIDATLAHARFTTGSKAKCRSARS